MELIAHGEEILNKLNMTNRTLPYLMLDNIVYNFWYQVSLIFILISCSDMFFVYVELSKTILVDKHLQLVLLFNFDIKLYRKYWVLLWYL